MHDTPQIAAPEPLVERPAAVIFDCDGVLVDSEPACFEMLATDLTAHGLALNAHQVEHEFIGGTMQGLWTRARAMGANLPDDWVTTFYDRLYARLALGTPLVAGVEQVMDALDRCDIPYGVGSNGSEQKMHVTLGQHPAVKARLAGRLFSGQTLAMPKPEPGLFLHVAAALGAVPARTVVIEDSPTGARAARAAGMVCFGYAPQGDGARLAAEGARVFRSMADLPALLAL